METGRDHSQSWVSVHRWLDISPVNCAQDHHDGVKLFLPDLRYTNAEKHHKSHSTYVWTLWQELLHHWQHRGFRNGTGVPSWGRWEEHKAIGSKELVISLQDMSDIYISIIDFQTQLDTKRNVCVRICKCNSLLSASNNFLNTLHRSAITCKPPA